MKILHLIPILISFAVPAAAQSNVTSYDPPVLVYATKTGSGIATTSTDAFQAYNTAPATSAKPAQWSPAFHWEGTSWNGTTSQKVDWWMEVQSSGSGTAGGPLVLSQSINGGSRTVIWSINSGSGGSTQSAGQFISTATTGTPPLVVASTTNVPNLNASSVNGATFASPGAIGGTTPSTGQFTSVIVKTGANASGGTVTLSSGAGTITSTAITTHSVIVFSLVTASGANAYPQTTVSAGSATVAGLATDNGTYNWVAILTN